MAAHRGIPVATVNLGLERAAELLSLQVEDRCEPALSFRKSNAIDRARGVHLGRNVHAAGVGRPARLKIAENRLNFREELHKQREIDRGWLGSHKVHYAKLQFLDAVRGCRFRLDLSHSSSI
jgi:hypothetical protein